MRPGCHQDHHGSRRKRIELVESVLADEGKLWGSGWNGEAACIRYCVILIKTQGEEVEGTSRVIHLTSSGSKNRRNKKKGHRESFGRNS